MKKALCACVHTRVKKEVWRYVPAPGASVHKSVHFLSAISAEDGPRSCAVYICFLSEDVLP